MLSSNYRILIKISCQKTSAWLKVLRIIITQKRVKILLKEFWLSQSRSDVIRTRDLCVPNAALYQAEPHFDLDHPFRRCTPLPNVQVILYISKCSLSTGFWNFFDNFFTTSLAKLNSTPLWNLILQKASPFQLTNFLPNYYLRKALIISGWFD